MCLPIAVNFLGLENAMITLIPRKWNIALKKQCESSFMLELKIEQIPINLLADTFWERYSRDVASLAKGIQM